jgi:hypothetical protein
MIILIECTWIDSGTCVVGQKSCPSQDPSVICSGNGDCLYTDTSNDLLNSCLGNNTKFPSSSMFSIFLTLLEAVSPRFLLWSSLTCNVFRIELQISFTHNSSITSYCSETAVDCIARCSCYDGYGGEDCSLDAQGRELTSFKFIQIVRISRWLDLCSLGLAEADTVRSNICSALSSTLSLQDMSAELMDVVVGSFRSAYNPYEIGTRTRLPKSSRHSYDNHTLILSLSYQLIVVVYFSDNGRKADMLECAVAACQFCKFWLPQWNCWWHGLFPHKRFIRLRHGCITNEFECQQVLWIWMCWKRGQLMDGCVF